MINIKKKEKTNAYNDVLRRYIIVFVLRLCKICKINLKKMSIVEINYKCVNVMIIKKTKLNLYIYVMF